jgi:hypothetical protein
VAVVCHVLKPVVKMLAGPGQRRERHLALKEARHLSLKVTISGPPANDAKLTLCATPYDGLRRSVVNSAAQECGDVAGTLCHRHDLDGTALSAVNHEVRADRPEQNRIRREVFAFVPHTRGAPQCLKSVEQFPDPAVGGVETIGRCTL